MTLLTLPDASYRGTLLPGGWTTHAPRATFSAADARMRDLVTVLKRYGATHAVAEHQALARVEHFWLASWKDRVMKTTARWAHIYEKEHGSLDGFDAALMARAWVPGLYAGKQQYGSLTVREMMQAMREAR